MHLKKLFICIIAILVPLLGFGITQKDTIAALIVQTAPAIDGKADDACWATAKWYPMDQDWIPYGAKVDSTDFYGRYKLAWDNDYLYLLVETTDNILVDNNAYGLGNYWYGDAVEIFLDEDHIAENQQYNYNAFSYHCGIHGNIIDLGTDQQAHYYNNNITMKVDTLAKHNYCWEFAIKVYNKTFDPNNTQMSRLQLTANKIMGFALAYCDNDSTNTRENFVGSINMPQAHANDNYITTQYFGPLRLIDPEKPVSIAAPLVKKDINIGNYPSGYLTIIPGDNNVSEVRIISSLGQNVKNFYGPLEDNQRLDVSSLKKGIYLVEIIKSDKTRVSKKILIN
jgi:hypothetical protein